MNYTEAESIMLCAYEATDLLEDALAVLGPRPVDAIGHARELRAFLAEVLDIDATATNRPPSPAPPSHTPPPAHDPPHISHEFAESVADGAIRLCDCLEDRWRAQRDRSQAMADAIAELHDYGASLLLNSGTAEGRWNRLWRCVVDLRNRWAAESIGDGQCPDPTT